MATPRTFVGGTGTTGIAPVAAIPTTAAHFALWNGEKLVGGNKSYLITSVGFTTTTSAGAVIVMQLLVHTSSGIGTSLSGTLAVGPKSTDGISGGSNAQVASAATIVQDSVWHPVGQALNSAALTATIGLGTWQNVRGLYTLAPGQTFSMAVLCSAAGSAICKCYVTWEEC